MADRPTKRRVPAPGSAGSGAKASRTGAAARSKAPAKTTGRTTAPPSSTRYTPPDRDPRHRPSPIYVPIAMFTLLGAGMLLIVANYINVFGDADNVRLIIGLGLILGGILVATQYR